MAGRTPIALPPGVHFDCEKVNGTPAVSLNRAIGIYGGVMAAMSFQLGFPAYRSARIL